MEQTNLFDFIEEEKFKFTKPIRLIELFAGYGSQALALKYLGVPFEHWKICEWAVKSIQAYKDLHYTNSKYDGIVLTKEEQIDYLFNKGISSNYNEPMTKKQIERLGEEKINTIYENIQITNNLVNIQQVKGADLDIKNTDKFTYLLTYSFPCQDLSLAGKQKGMHDTNTRSGMLWEVERILTECYELGQLPKVLLMENVPQVHGKKNLPDFNKWLERLKELGYTNYWQDLIATDYGIPQTRNRTFMISILGNENYTFPQPQELKLKLKDMLEDNVNEKFYLSTEQIINLENNNYKANKPSNKLAITEKGLCQTIDTMNGGNRQPLVRVKDYNLKTTNKGLIKTLEKNNIEDGDFINTYNQNVQKNVSGTITTGIDFRNNNFIGVKY